MSVVGNLSPLLFMTFRSLYGISYSLLGLLVVINFCSQLIIDLIFSFFSHKFNIQKVVKITPLITIVGFIIYAIWPFIFPSSVYLGLIIGTIIFSTACGLNEVLLSPIIAAIPAENPEHEMSKLHSMYAGGVVGVVIISTLFLLVFKNTNWNYLALLFTIIPLVSFIAFCKTDIPNIETPKKTSGALNMLKNKQLWLCVLAIFLGGACEQIMTQWSSSYLEQAMGIPKVWGDIFGVSLFALMLVIGRTLYAKKGKNIEKILLLGAIGTAVCYFIASITTSPTLVLLTCALTGFCVSMFWPGCLMISSKRIIKGGVFVYAIMAAGGDLGSSLGPQLLGLITDSVFESSFALNFASDLGISIEQFAMKSGMLIGMIFPLIAIFIYSIIFKTINKKQNML